jgi:transposase
VFKHVSPQVNRLRRAAAPSLSRFAAWRKGVGPLVAVTFKSAVDDPSRITKSTAVGALFGLTPKKYQSGERHWRDHASRQ